MDHSEYREEIPHGDHPVSYDHAEPKARDIALYMAATVVLLAFVGIAIQQYYELSYAQQEQNVVLAPDNWALQNLRNKEEWELTHYSYIEKEKGTVRMPIEEAMRMVVRDSAANTLKYPVNPYPVKTPEELAAAGSPAAANASATINPSATENVQPPAPAQQK